MLAQGFEFLLRTLFDLLSAAFLLRFFLQAVRAPARNPLSTFVIAMTDFAVRPARRVIPGWRGCDLASLLLAWIAATLPWAILLSLRGALGEQPLTEAGALLLLGAAAVLRLALYVVLVAVLIHALLSWFNPRGPAAPLAAAMARPFIAPFQRVIPAIGGADLSPVWVIILCQLLITVVVPWLEKAAVDLF